jgi:hydroxyacylglutathione hydrolase
MLLEYRAAPPFMENGYVLGCEDTREGVIIDPGESVDELLDLVTREKLTIKHILLTHAHLDHVTGVGRAKSMTGAPVALHADDRPLYEAVVQQGMMFGIRVERQPPVDAFYDVTKTIAFGRYEVRVHHTPGHSPGGVCLEIIDSKGETNSTSGRAPTLIVGDTLFAGSIGRTDLPGGNYDTLINAIRTVLFAFPDDAIAYPGHGEPTTIGRERRTNPFLT